MNKLALALSAIFITGCASTGGANHAESVGKFIHAGPISTKADVLSIRWNYGIKFTVDPASIGEVKFNCAPISSSTFTVKGADLKFQPDGTVFVEGAALPVSKEATPWFLDGNHTSATCEAIVSRNGKADSSMKASVNFSAAVKTAILGQLKVAHDFNSPSSK
jgi:hypothetical protein